ncbi:MAG: phosphatase PAP2 family protein [Magnetovibrio sp.]|nr:phosphatase PAP2 family protein [Magnetovibrio sp.]
MTWKERLRAELHHHTLLFVITMAYCIGAVYYLAAHDIFGLPVFQDYLIGAAIPLAAMASFRIFGETAYHTLHVRPFRAKGLWAGIWQSEIFSPERLLAAAIPVMLLPLFSSVFTSFKTSIPEVAPFAWDTTLMEWDLALHGGIHPWELLQPILGHPFVSSAFSYLYNLWHGMIFVVYWQMFRIQDRELRMQFLISFVLAWVFLGSIGALLFSSAGPCYYELVVTGPNPFADQMAYLYAAHEQFPNRALLAQEYLWGLYETGRAGLGGGISAMPSLHVGVALLIFFLARRFNTKAAWLAGGYGVIVMVGSVHLGWHYAIDGYVAIIGAIIAWRLSGWLVQRLVPPAPPAASP